MVAQRNTNYRPRNPFVLATPVSKKLKVLFYGPSGSGKTLAALTFPKVAYINAEGGADMYAGRGGIKPFHWFSCKTITDLETALDYIEYDSGTEFETLVIDPITVFYDVLKEAGARAAKTGTLGFREWAQINNRMKAVYNRLTNLPVHVVVIGRESIEYEGTGDNLRKAGVKPDADKSLVYIFDFIVRMTPDHKGIVEKSRGMVLGNNGNLPKVGWEVFELAAKAYTTGQQQKQQSEEEAVEQQAEALKSMTEDEVKQLVSVWQSEGITIPEMLVALGGIERFSEFKGDYTAANDRIKAWQNAQLEPPPPAPESNPENGEPEAKPEAAKSEQPVQDGADHPDVAQPTDGANTSKRKKASDLDRLPDED
jgi:hypothetical protein